MTLINSHGLKESENLKIDRYDSYTKNVFNEINDGIAIEILVKNNIMHKIKDDLFT